MGKMKFGYAYVHKLSGCIILFYKIFALILHYHSIKQTVLEITQYPSRNPDLNFLLNGTIL